MRAAILILLGIFSTPASADQPISLIRVLCIPEKGMPHFSVNVEPYTEAAEYIQLGRGDGAPNEKEKRIKTLRKYGLIYPQNFEYECKLSDHTYRIEGNEPLHQAHGQCGGDPRITISLYKDDVPLLKNVYLTKSCFTSLAGAVNPYVSRIVVDEGIQGWESTKVWADISNADDTKYLGIENQYTIEKEFKAITQEYIGCIVGKGFFDSKLEQQALGECRGASHKALHSTVIKR